MTVYQVNPLHDPRWPELVDRHLRVSVFHTNGWLEALQRTYAYEPVAFTTSAPAAELRKMVVFCEIRSWLTGRRVVSLPFSDHCEPLVDGSASLAVMREHLQTVGRARRLRYFELRTGGKRARRGVGPREYGDALDPPFGRAPEPGRAVSRVPHELHPAQDPARDTRAAGLLGGAKRRELLQAFYRLLLLTRRRHGLPPQPFAWFRQLAIAMGPALKVGHPIAGIVTLRHRDVLSTRTGARPKSSTTSAACISCCGRPSWRPTEMAAPRSTWVEPRRSAQD